MIDNLRHRQQGLTIVELMVAMAIGLLIGLVVFASYMSGIGTQRAQTDLTRLEESARFSFDLLSRAIRRAGHRHGTITKNPPNPNPPAFCATGALGKGIAQTDSTFNGVIRATNDATTVDLGGGVSANVLNNSDTITVRYYGQDDPTAPAPGTADGAVLDCLGNAVSRAGGKADGSPVQDTIYVAADPANNNEPTLFCSTDNPAAPIASRTLALIPGVESLQLLYAEDNKPLGEEDGTATRYVPAAKVGKMDWVQGVLVSVVVRTPNATGSDHSAKTFNHFGAGYDAAAADDAAGATFTGAADGRTRLQFSHVISLRNISTCD